MKKLLTILVLIMLIISFFQITKMYALYKEQIKGDYSNMLGIWSIKVNNTDITSGGQEVEFNITDDQLKYINSEYIQAGKIAPDGEAYVDIVIDALDTDVSIIYQIDIGATTTENEANIKFLNGENYFGQGDDGQTNKTANDVENENQNSYTSIIPIDMIKQQYKNYVRLYFKWEDADSMDETDSILASEEGKKISVPIQINLKQYIGENIGSEK